MPLLHCLPSCLQCHLLVARNTAAALAKEEPVSDLDTTLTNVTHTIPAPPTVVAPELNNVLPPEPEACKMALADFFDRDQVNLDKFTVAADDNTILEQYVICMSLVPTYSSCQIY